MLVTGVAIFFLAAALFSHYRGLGRLSFAFLLFCALALAWHAVDRDPYLHPWDERFHALVALNAMDDPWHPKLYPDKVVEVDYSAWYVNHTWLHKQPLFTWQMALGMKIFGTSLAGMRSSSVLMFLLLVAVVYFTARRAYTHRGKALLDPALWLGLLVVMQPFLLFLVNGRQGIDHNDLAFITWVAVSFWAFVAYQKTERWLWIILVGLSVAAAMLTKWLAGSLLLWVWGLYLLLRGQWRWRPWLHLLLSGALALALFLPWQFYAAQRFPELYWAEWEYNTRHFSEVIEEHQGSWLYHLKQWNKHFPIISLLFLLTILRDLWRRQRLSPLRLSLYLTILAVHVFYAVAATKMPSFTFLLLPIVLLLVGDLLPSLFRRFGYYGVSLLLVLLGGKMAFRYFSVEEDQDFVERQIALREYCQEISYSLPEKTVLFNVPSMQTTDFMYYLRHPAYDFRPRSHHLEQAIERGYAPMILLSAQDSIYPEWEDYPVQYRHLPEMVRQ